MSDESDPTAPYYVSGITSRTDEQAEPAQPTAGWSLAHKKTRGRAGLQALNADVTERRDLPLCVGPVGRFDQGTVFGTVLGGPVESPSMEGAALANRSWCSFASERWTKGAGALRAISRNFLASSVLPCSMYNRAR